MSTYIDSDGNVTTSALDGDKQIFQDFLKIYHKTASPRSIWSFPEATNPDDFNGDNPKSLAAFIKAMKAGDRLATPMKAEIITEGIDPQARFTDGIDKIVDPEVSSGLQSTVNRLINDPSAMADAKEASKAVNDPKSTGIMQDFLEWINFEVIPKVRPQKDVEFTWGSQDDFEFDPQLALSLLGAGVIGKSELRKMVEDIGMPLDDTLYQKDQQEEIDKQKDMIQHQADVKNPDSPDKQEPSDKDVKEAKIEAYRAIIKKLGE